LAGFYGDFAGKNTAWISSAYKVSTHYLYFVLRPPLNTDRGIWATLVTMKDQFSPL